VKQKILTFGLLFLHILAVQLVFSQDIEIKTYVDRVKVPAGQQFSFTIEISGSDAQAVASPQLPDLSSFADYIGSSTSQSFQFINNKMTASKSTVNFFIARAEGKHQIPAVSLNYKGKSFRSEPITIEISQKDASAPAPGKRPSAQPRTGARPSQLTPASTLEGNIFLKAEVDRKSVFPNQPVNIIHKIYTRVDISGFTISKLPDLLGFWSEDFSMPSRPRTYEEIVDGKKFLVAEVKKSAAFPTTPGGKVIDPLEIECEVRLREQDRSRDIFDRFFNEDFFGKSLFGRRVRTRIASKPIKIEVKPLPEAGKPGDFSGLVGNFGMAASLDKDQVQTNEAVTLKVRFSGAGNVKMIPEPNIVFPPNIETYEPKTSQKIDRSGDIIRGNKTFEYVLIPRFAGEFRVRPFFFSYFDPIKGKYQTERSPEFLIRVAAGSDQGIVTPSGLSREEIKLIGKDIRFIKLSSDTFQRIGDYFYHTYWFVLLLALPLMILGVALAYRRRQDLMAGNLAYARSRRAHQMAKKRLSKAHKLMNPETQKEFYAEISRAMLGFIADKLNLSAAGMNSDEVVTSLKLRNVKENVISELLDCLRECDFQRFAPSDSNVDRMKTFYELAKSAIIDLDRAKLG
jgi:hypothetical protein